MYSTDIAELVYTKPIKEGYCRSNKNQATRQILAQYSKQKAIRMRLLPMEALQKVNNTAEIGTISIFNQGIKIQNCSIPQIPRHALKRF